MNRPPYRGMVGRVQASPLAFARRRRRYLRVDRTVQLVEGRPAPPYASLVIEGARGGQLGAASVSRMVGAAELLEVLERTIDPHALAIAPARIGALGWRTIELLPIGDGLLELTIYGPNAGEQGRIVLDEDGRRELREHVAAALEREPAARTEVQA